MGIGIAMVHASDFEPISIRGRFAFALTCLEVIGEQWRIEAAYFHDLIGLLWEFTSRDLLVKWFDEVRELTGPRRRDFPERLRVAAPHLSSDQVHAVQHAVNELVSLGGIDMYVEPQVWNTIGPTLNVAGILLRWGLPLPRLERFARSRWGERRAFGDNHPREFFGESEPAEPGAAAAGGGTTAFQG
jgi:hypothetical protein